MGSFYYSSFKKVAAGKWIENLWKKLKNLKIPEKPLNHNEIPQQKAKNQFKYHRAFFSNVDANLQRQLLIRMLHWYAKYIFHSKSIDSTTALLTEFLERDKLYSICI
jgi:hypothetical protein